MLEDQCTTNKFQHIVRQEEHQIFKPKLTIRKHFNNASIFQDDAIDYLEYNKLNQKQIISGLFSNKKIDQQHKEPIIDSSHNSQGKSVNTSYKLNGHDTKLDNVQLKTNHTLSIQKDSYYDTSYRNIPNTIMHNLSQLFDKHRTGVNLNTLMKLYLSEYGQAYEPLKYGFSSEHNMFESLDKMVEFKNNMLYTKDPFAYTKLLKNTNSIDNNEKTSIILPDKDFLLNYLSEDICNAKFMYSKVKIHHQRLIKVIVAEIYNPSSFYIQLAANVSYLNSFMDKLQEFYNENEDKYRVSPNLILPKLACTACLKSSKLWHRALVLKIVDEKSVQLFYVDYGSIEIVPKINIRLLELRFGSYSIQAVHCGLYKCDELNYSREISESFADMVESHVLVAQFHPPISEGDSQKMNVTLHLNTENEKININKSFLQYEELLKQIKKL